MHFNSPYKFKGGFGPYGLDLIIIIELFLQKSKKLAIIEIK